jgi:hypothetical protein
LGVSVRIEAGPGTDGSIPEFPLADTCYPSGPGQPGEACLKWDYRWTVSWTGDKTPNLVEAVVSVDSDITVLAATPPVQVSKLLGIVNLGEGERFLDFPASGLTWTASYWTPLNATPGTLTAGFVVKKGFLPLAGRCALAGANNVGGDLNQPVADEQSFETPGCTAAFRLAPNGKLVYKSLRITDGTGCSKDESDAPITINGDPVLFVTPVQFTQKGGSCKYSYVNTAGGTSTITCTACCIAKSTNKCVAKPADSSTWPTFCMPGTY